MTLTFSEYPDALPWLEANCPTWRDYAAAIGNVTAGAASEEYAAVALWLAETQTPDNPLQQRRIIATHLIRRLAAATDCRWPSQHKDLGSLLKAIDGVLRESLPQFQPASVGN